MCVSWLFCVKRTFIHFDDVDADDRLETCSCTCLSLTQCLFLLCPALIAAGPAHICFFPGIEQELEMMESTSVHGVDDERFGGVDGCCTCACSGVVFGGGRVLCSVLLRDKETCAWRGSCLLMSLIMEALGLFRVGRGNNGDGCDCRRWCWLRWVSSRCRYVSLKCCAVDACCSVLVRMSPTRILRSI